MKSEKRKNNICLMGASFDTGNMGVAALAASLMKLVTINLPDADVSFLIGNRSGAPQKFKLSDREIYARTVNFRLSPRANLRDHLLWIFLLACLYRILPFEKIRRKILDSNRSLETLVGTDFVGDIHGGDSFSDIYGLGNFILGSIPNILTFILKKDLILLPQTYGPYSSLIARVIAKFILNNSSMILSRDVQGFEVVRKLIGKQSTASKFIFCPDVAFALDSIQPDILDIKPKLPEKLNTPLIGLNINGLMYNGGYTRDNMFGLKLDYKEYLQKLIIKLMKETPVHMLLIPHTFGSPGNINSDPDACLDILSSLGDLYNDRIHLVAREYDQSEIKGIIGLCDFFVGSRMHACIASLSQGIPTVAIAYSKKFKGVFDSIGVGEMVIDGRYEDTEAALRSTYNSFLLHKETKPDIQEKVYSAQNLLHNNFQQIFNN